MSHVHYHFIIQVRISIQYFQFSDNIKWYFMLINIIPMKVQYLIIIKYVNQN